MRTLLIVSVIAALANAPLTQARPVRMWTIEDLSSQSDFVVLAQITGIDNGPTRTTLMQNVPAIEKQAALRVVHFFKQNAPATEMALKWYQPEQWPPSGPSGFSPQIGAYYLMFLKREFGLQRFESVTGDIDPGMGLFLISQTDRPQIPSGDSQLDAITNLLSRAENPQIHIPPKNKQEVMDRFEKYKQGNPTTGSTSYAKPEAAERTMTNSGTGIAPGEP